MHACNACMHTYMHTCTHAHMHTCTHACMHTCIHAHMHACMHTCIHAYMYTSIHTYMHACMPACLHTYMPTCLHPYIHTYIHTSIHTSIHPYIHPSIHPYIHTYIYTYIFYIHTYKRPPHSHGGRERPPHSHRGGREPWPWPGGWGCRPVSYIIYIWQRFETLPHAHINDFFEHDWLNIRHTTSHQVSAQRKAELLQWLPPRLTSPEPLGIYGSPKWGCHVLMSTYFNLWKRGHHQISDIIDIYWMI